MTSFHPTPSRVLLYGVALPNEVWSHIFEDTMQPVEFFSTQEVLRLLLVCSTWKECAMPLIYRHLKFRHNDSLKEFLILLMSKQSGADSPGKWVHTVRIGSSCVQLAEIREFLTLLLHRLPHLRSFIAEVDLPVSALDALAHTCGPTLRSLSLVLSASDSLEGARFHVITLFKALQDLSITISGPVDSDYVPIQGSPSFNMPSLKRLSWSWELPWIFPSFLELLSRSHFIGLTHFSLRLPRFDPDLHAGLLEPFLQAHGPQLAWLDVRATEYTLPVISALASLTALRHVAFSDSAPSAFEVIPRSVRELSFVMPTRQNCTDVWHFLDTVSHTNVKEIHLLMPNASSSPFTWTSLSDVDSFIAVKLVEYALKLAQREIEVLDTQGKSLRLVH